ncbi:MAG: acyl carrier protein [Alphaproteobacteria bacterium PA2]|nr:MAG: acyl carrier protein [Alphaproteobacteria bacterium PA2]
MNEQIREIVARHGGLAVDVAGLDEAADLYEAGMTSFASVDLMLGLEEAFDIEFPDALLTRKTFASISSIAEAVTKLSAKAA